MSHQRRVSTTTTNINTTTRENTTITRTGHITTRTGSGRPIGNDMRMIGEAFNTTSVISSICEEAFSTIIASTRGKNG